MTTDLIPKKRRNLLNDLVELLGQDATMQLLSHYGGLQRYIPKRMPEQHPLSLLLGHENAQKLAVQYGGSYLDFPMSKKLLQQQRQLRIQRMHNAGVPVPQIVKKLGCSRRYVYWILAKQREATAEATGLAGIPGV